MKKLKTISLAALITAGMLFQGCTDLEEQALDGVRQQSAETEYAINDGDPADLLSGVYDGLRGSFQGHERLFEMGELNSDAAVGPTRGGDWDDNGVFRAQYTHTYAPDHLHLGQTFVDFYSNINRCNFVVGSGATGQILAEARFIRALNYYFLVDLFGQVAYREIGSDPNANALVYTRSEATNFVISELEAIISDLPASDPTKANQNAAHWLLAKVYLNKAVFLSENPAGPYTFDNADMTQVVSNVDAISGVTLATDYWDNFIPTNTETSSELIFVSQNFNGGPNGGINNRWHMGQHYNQTPSGWNGFTTLSDYYNKFDPNDPRITYWEPTVTENSGYNLGFQVGQQYGPGGPGVGPALEDRKNNPLIFTPEVDLIVGGDALEVAGIRGVKYMPDYADEGNPNNDYVVARYADALLMKAEAMARMGDTGGAQTIVNMLQYEDTTTIGSVDDILDVRARVLWWEGWRRNDTIRFEQYLGPKELKDYEDDPRAVLMPIPAAALANPNFSQNPGY